MHTTDDLALLLENPTRTLVQNIYFNAIAINIVIALLLILSTKIFDKDDVCFGSINVGKIFYAVKILMIIILLISVLARLLIPFV